MENGTPENPWVVAYAFEHEHDALRAYRAACDLITSNKLYAAVEHRHLRVGVDVIILFSADLTNYTVQKLLSLTCEPLGEKIDLPPERIDEYALMHFRQKGTREERIDYD